MKKKLLLFFFTITSFIYAQPPEGINYQAIARRASTGEPIANKTIKVRYTISDGTGADFQEEKSLTTNSYGLFTHIIGSGPQTSAKNFSDIEWWSSVPTTLAIHIDTTNSGNTYIPLLPAQPFQSVPYSFYSKKAAIADYANTTNIADSAKNTPKTGIGTPNYLVKYIDVDSIGKSISISELPNSNGNVGIGSPPLTQYKLTAGHTLIKDSLRLLFSNGSYAFPPPPPIRPGKVLVFDINGNLKWSTDTIGNLLNNWKLNGNDFTGNFSTINPFIGTKSNHPLIFKTNNQQRMVIDTLGNVGIGIDPDQTRLKVSKTDVNGFNNTAIRVDVAGIDGSIKGINISSSTISGNTVNENVGEEIYSSGGVFIKGVSITTTGLQNTNSNFGIDINSFEGINNIGIRSLSNGGNNSNNAYGIYTIAKDANDTTIGVYAKARSDSGTAYAGWFQGQTMLNGAVNMKVERINNSITLGENNSVVILDASFNPINSIIDLPQAQNCKGRVYYIKNTQFSNINLVFMSRNIAFIIDSNFSDVNNQIANISAGIGQTIILISDGTQWWTLSN